MTVCTVDRRVPARRSATGFWVGITAALAVLAGGAVPAHAVVPGPRAKAMPIVVTEGGRSVGRLNFDVSYSESGAKGVASASQLKLTSGRRYRLRTCVWAKAPGRRPDVTCRRKTTTIDFFGALGGISAPTASLAVQRPGAGAAAATIAGTVVIDQLNGTRATDYARSWPAGGLPAAGVAVPALDQTAGTVLPPQGTPVPGLRGGGINTGAQDSICQGEEDPATGPARGSTDVLGPLAAPYEVLEASGSRPRGTMILLHGGSWALEGRGALERMRAEADRWQARGWRTVNGSYSPCGASIDDVVAIHDRVRQTYGSKRPICAMGQSSGGHLALLLASLRPQLACVVSEAGLADLTTWAGQGYAESSLTAVKLSNVAASAFGADRLEQMSPERLGVKARVLYGIGVGDNNVPWGQASSFAKAQRSRDSTSYVDAVRIAPGAERWVHASVSSAALSDFYAREHKLITPLVKGEVRGPARVALGTLRRGGLRVSYTCPTRCTVSAKLTRRGKTLGARRARSSQFVTSTFTIRVGSRARRQLERGTLKLVGEVRVDGKTRRFVSRVRAR